MCVVERSREKRQFSCKFKFKGLFRTDAAALLINEVILVLLSPKLSRPDELTYLRAVRSKTGLLQLDKSSRRRRHQPA